MNINITLSAESISELKAVLTPPSAPLFDPKSPFGPDLAEEIMNAHGNDLVNGIVDQRGSDLVRKIAEKIDASEVASYIDMGDLANEVEIDHDDVARIVADNMDMTDLARDVADEVEWSEHINHKQIALQLVSQFVNNKEFRDCFVDALVERLADSKV
jgi:hypothetical protein